jgi:hypothetical protein
VYVADGHSGSSITTAALANLTGSFVNPWAPYWPELFGDNIRKALAVKSPVKFMSQFFCNGRRMYPKSRLTGFKWKTYGSRYQDTELYDEAWKYISQHKVPVVWALRNTLDVLISDAFHWEQRQNASTTTIRVMVARNSAKTGNTLAEKVNMMEDAKEKIRRKLLAMNVTHHITSYERLFHNDSETKVTAWKRMLQFYGLQRLAESLTLPRIQLFIDHYSTSSEHNDHGAGPPRSRASVVENLGEVLTEYTRIMKEREERRAAGTGTVAHKRASASRKALRMFSADDMPSDDAPQFFFGDE